MKKIIITTIVSVVNLYSFSQNALILRGIGNFASVTSDEALTTNTGSGINVQVSGRTSVGFSLGKELDLAVKTKIYVSYNSLGNKAKVNNVTEELVLDYVQLTGMIRLLERNRLSVFAGAYAGGLVNAKLKTPSTDKDVIDSVRKLDLGASIEGLLALDKKERLSLFIGWNPGLNSVYKGNKKGTNNSLNIGVQLKLARRRK